MNQDGATKDKHYHKLVRVFPERADPEAELEHARKNPQIYGRNPLPTVEEEVKRIVAFSEEKGYPSGTIAKVVMVSRFGDAGLSRYLRAGNGYDIRLFPECIEVIHDDEAAKLLEQYDAGLLNTNHPWWKHITRCCHISRRSRLGTIHEVLPSGSALVAWDHVHGRHYVGVEGLRPVLTPVR